MIYYDQALAYVVQEMKKDEFSPMPRLRLKDIHEFVMERFKESKEMGDLVQFHSINKYLIMAHSPNHLNRLGNIVANHDKLKISDVLEKYLKELKKAFSIEPTIKSHFNTLQHIFGHFSPDLSRSEKRYFIIILQNFRESKIPLNEALQILKDCTEKYEKLYLVRQTYFLFFTNPHDIPSDSLK